MLLSGYAIMASVKPMRFAKRLVSRGREPLDKNAVRPKSDKCGLPPSESINDCEVLCGLLPPAPDNPDVDT